MTTQKYTGNNSADVTECPVCLEWYQDPRLLHCGHYFCLPCLQKIAETRLQGNITCPTCRHVTSDKVTDLPRYKVNEFRVKVKSFLQGEVGRVSVPCVYCTDRAAARSCWRCSISFCEGCAGKHALLESLPGHRPAPVSPLQFCPAHPGSFVQAVCSKCNVGCCHLCDTRHRGHAVEDVHQAAKRARTQLKENVLAKVTLEGDMRVMASVQSALQTMRSRQTEFQGSVSSLRRLLQDTTAALDATEADAGGKLEGEIKELEILESDIRISVKTKEDLLSTVTDLTNSASDPEVVLRSAQLPVYASDSCLDGVQKRSANVPNLENLVNMEKHLSDTAKSPLAVFRSMYLLRLKLADRRVKSLELGGGVTGMTYMYGDTMRGLVLRRKGPLHTRIQVYNSHLERVTSLGTWSHDIEDEGHCDIAFDCKTKCYISPTASGHIVIMNQVGMVIKKIKVHDGLLNGICCLDDQSYLASCEGQRELFVIDKETGSISRRYDSYVAYHLCSCSLTWDGETRSVVLISNNANASVDVVEHSGKRLHRFLKTREDGIEMAVFGQVCVEPGGNRVLVCDRDNHRVVALWKEGGQGKMEVLLGKSDLPEKPLFIVCDGVDKRVFVGNEKGLIHTWSYVL